MKPLKIFPLKITRDLVLISFGGIPKDYAKIRGLLDFFQIREISIAFLAEGSSGKGEKLLTIAINKKDYAKLSAEMEELRSVFGGQNIAIMKDVVLIRILGAHFDIQPGIANLLFRALNEAKVPVLANSTTITSSLIIVSQERMESALRAVASVFHVPKQKGSIL